MRNRLQGDHLAACMILSISGPLAAFPYNRALELFKKQRKIQCSDAGCKLCHWFQGPKEKWLFIVFTFIYFISIVLFILFIYFSLDSGPLNKCVVKVKPAVKCHLFTPPRLPREPAPTAEKNPRGNTAMSDDQSQGCSLKVKFKSKSDWGLIYQSLFSQRALQVCCEFELCQSRWLTQSYHKEKVDPLFQWNPRSEFLVSTGWLAIYWNRWTTPP